MFSCFCDYKKNQYFSCHTACLYELDKEWEKFIVLLFKNNYQKIRPRRGGVREMLAGKEDLSS